MTKQRKLRLKPNKIPEQKRSKQMFEDILEAAIRVLESKPGSLFTTIRVAEKAGVSVGSLYQYFPNKESILFELQMREARQTTESILAILNDNSMSPLVRIELALQFFFISEWEERKMRSSLSTALGDFKTSIEFSLVRNQLRIYLEDFFDKYFSSKNVDCKFFCFLVSNIAEGMSEEIQDPKQFHLWSERSIELLLNQLK